jgi:hypothetical protein
MSAGEGDRRRLAVLLLFVGMALILVAEAAYISWEQKRLPPPTTQLTEAQKAQVRARLRAPVRILVVTSGLVLGFAIFLYAFLAWSRSYRARLTRRPSRPTPVEDIWSMHKVPENLPDDSDDEPDAPTRE